MEFSQKRVRLVIMGAGGRDFHNFNMLFRDNPAFEVVAFTATQIPFQQGRTYPPQLSGPLYPKGIPIVAEQQLPRLIERHRVDEVILAYSDLSHQVVMEIASRVMAMGPDFRLVGPRQSMLQASIPVVSVCAVRTGCGKSPVTRDLCRTLRAMGHQPTVVRHPMAYGRLDIRAAESFRTCADLDTYECTLEEREEYEPLIDLGIPLFAGVDYAEIMQLAQKAGDVLIWDGGNNDLPFIRPDLELVLVDPLRPGHELSYFPGMANLLRADGVILAKAADATSDQLALVEKNVSLHNPKAELIRGALEVSVDDPEQIRGKRVVLVEDGPTLTHGGMGFGAAMAAAKKYGAGQIVDPRPYAVGSLIDVFRDYPHLEQAVPAMGYSESQIADLAATLEAIPCDLVLSGTPIDLQRVISLHRPLARVSYDFREMPPVKIPRLLKRLFEGGG